MNEYLLTSDSTILQQVYSAHDQFDAAVAELERVTGTERALIGSAGQANDEFIEVFLSSLALRPGNLPSQRRLALVLDRGEQDGLAPLHALQPLNARRARERESEANAQSSHALIATLAAGLLAIGGGLGFAWYAVRLVRRVDRQNEALRELDRVKDDFVASVSHELRMPLTSITGYLELVLDDDVGGLSEEQRSYLAVVNRNSERLLHLVGDLLFVARLSGSSIALEKVPLELSELARQSVEAARPAAQEAGLELTLECNGPADVEADPSRIAQVIDNLLTNALKFTPPGGRVALSIHAEDDAVVLEVADTGMGISALDQEHLFERFFRSSDAITKAIQGTGLGLSIVVALVEAHGGAIGVESEIGVGTKFTVVLPRVRVEERIAA